MEWVLKPRKREEHVAAPPGVRKTIRAVVGAGPDRA